VLLKKLCLPATLLLLNVAINAQPVHQKATDAIIDTSIFNDAAHHWYDIFDKSNVIQPKKGQPRYAATNITAIADNILLYQKNNGGWPKNYDVQAILTKEQKDSLVASKNEENTTFDNRTTYSHIGYLSKAWYQTKNDAYKKAALKGLNYIINAQYENGGWPQYYPLEKGYSRHITYNDDAYAGIMWLLKNIKDGNPEYAYIDTKLRSKLDKAYAKGLDCILKTQIKDNGRLTAWCQQYDEVTLQPAWARAFEPPSICNGESVNVILLLMSIEHPDQKVIDAIQGAMQWFNESKINGIRIETVKAAPDTSKYRISTTDKIVVQDANAPIIWSRYYEVGTHRPLFCNRDSKLVYSLAEVARERRDGYSWYTYEPLKVLRKYPSWQKKWAPEKNVLNND